MILLILIALSAFWAVSPMAAAIGDNAPPIPATYKTAHPRLPAPDSAYLTSLAGNATALAAYNADANAWDSTNPGTDWYLRRLLIAYLANKTANPTLAATYLTKIKALTNLAGIWGPLLYTVDDGVANGTNVVTSASADFTTACGGSSCAGMILGISGTAYSIVSVSTHSMTLPSGWSVPAGTNLKVRITNSGTGRGGAIALVYDWIYNDLDAATRTEFMNELDALCTFWENYYVFNDVSPYNDVAYIDGTPFGLTGALAIYPDHPKGLAHLKFAMDVWFNRMLPVWRQVLGPEGGEWHEPWNSYVNRPSGLDDWIVPSLLAWQTASGDPIFARESWLRNFGYGPIYMTRPDLVMEAYGDVTDPYLNAEDFQGSLNGLAEIYNDPVLRSWSRMLNGRSNDFEPSAWPFYAPDKSSNTNATPYTTLPLTRNMTGFGLLSMRTGWTEDDTSATLRYGDNFWSHQHSDVGAFTIFNRGALAIDSGSYVSGYNASHHAQYDRQTIAHNTLTILDPADYYPNVTYPLGDQTHDGIYYLPSINDGGQRQVGSRYNNIPQTVSPDSIGDWLRNWDYYHMGQMVGLANTPSYTYTAVDITAAYNNKFSSSTPTNIQNRTKRVQSAVRHMLFIPRGKSAYVIIFDQVASTNASFVKRWLLHSVNQPTVSGNKFVIKRDELAGGLPYPDLWPQRYQNQLKYSNSKFQYQYDGQLYGWTVLPQSANIGVVGGPGNEFYVPDPLNPGSGTNWNQCGQGLCPANWGLGPVAGYVNPVPAESPREPGSWRLEISPSTPATQDYFLHVMLATTTEDTSVPVSVTIPANLPAGTVGATWTEGGKTYTVTFPQSGVGGHITVTGVVDEELMAHAQQLPYQMAISSGNSQSAAAGAALANPLAVVVTDNAGKPVPNTTVHWGITQGSGYVNMGISTTNAQGIASTTLNVGAANPSGSINVMADVNGLTPVQFSIAVSGSVGAAITSVTCPTSIASGSSGSCTVALSQAATTSLTVGLSSDNQTLSVPANVAVGVGASTATFTATAGATSTSQTATITATLGSISQTTTVTVPPPAPPMSISSLTCAPGSLASGGSSTCTVRLTQAAGSGGALISLGAGSSPVTVPASVTIAAGSISATFTATAGTVTTGQTAIITATMGASSQTSSLTLSVGTPPSTTGNWVMTVTHGYPIETVGWEKLVYAPSPVKKAVFLGNYHELGSEPNEALVAYDFASNTWSVLDIGSLFHSEYMPEAGHPTGNFAYDPNQQRFIYYCCNSGSNAVENPYFMWWYDPIGQAGRSKQTSPKPINPQLGSSTFDASTNTFVLHGGNSMVGTWTYNESTNTFQHQTTNGTAPDPSLSYHSMVYNPTDHQVYLFGGASAAGYSNDLFAYNVASNTWTKIAPSGGKPPARIRAGFAYDSVNNIFMVFGGVDSAQNNLNDSWIFNPSTGSWNQLTPQQSPPAAGNFETLTYDPDDNAFILVVPGFGGYADGQWNGYPAQTWWFRYAGPGTNPGTISTTAAPPPGSINRNFNAWGKEPSLASSGNELYTTWIETGQTFDSSSAAWNHVYAKSYTGQDVVDMTPTMTAIDSEFNGYSESQSPSMAIIGGTPWIAWYKWNNSGAPFGVWVKSWNGASWVGGMVPQVVQGVAYDGRPQITGVGGTPYVAFLESDKTAVAPKTFVYVESWNGTKWTLAGSALNANASGNTTATSVSITSDGTQPYVAWAEYTTQYTTSINHSPAQIYVARWNGSQWVMVGNAINVSAANTADDVSITYANGQPYVAWTERTVGGNAQVYVKTLTGSSWALVGSGSLNKDTANGWAYKPSLAADPDSGAVYLGWVEQQSNGQRNQVYVSRLSAGTWAPLAGSLNANTALGSAQRVSVAVVSGQPVAGWGEVNAGALRQVFLKQWNGSSWALMSGNQSANTTCDVNRDGALNVLDVQAAINQVSGITACGTADLQQTGTCTPTDVQRVITAVLGGACKVGQ